MADLAAATQARLDKSLDKLYRFPGLGVLTFRDLIFGEAIAYTVEHRHQGARTAYGVILRTDAAEALKREPSTMYPGSDHPLQGLTWAAYLECPKIVADNVQVPRIITGRDLFEVVS